LLFFLFLNLSQSLSATGHSEGDLSEAAVKTRTKGFQRNGGEGELVVLFAVNVEPLLCLGPRGEEERECVSQL